MTMPAGPSAVNGDARSRLTRLIRRVAAMIATPKLEITTIPAATRNDASYAAGRLWDAFVTFREWKD